jgi:hypothetical protein
MRKIIKKLFEKILIKKIISITILNIQLYKYLRILIPKIYKKRLDIDFELWNAMSIFRNAKLKKIKDLYYQLDPMPNQELLVNFYEKCYWQTYRRHKIDLIRSRDVEHFNLIKEYCEFDASKKILNFGSGPGGGISHLFFHTGHKVINIEPGPWVDYYSSPNYKHYNSIDELPRNLKIDLLYGSHSLEHVSNLDEIERFIQQSINPGGFVFWEVPNAMKSSSSEVNIQPPHTYYFSRRYFDQLKLDKIFNLTFHDGEVMKNGNGSVIRYLGRVR